jgi:hypothetical protein
MVPFKVPWCVTVIRCLKIPKLRQQTFETAIIEHYPLRLASLVMTGSQEDFHLFADAHASHHLKQKERPEGRSLYHPVIPAVA